MSECLSVCVCVSAQLSSLVYPAVSAHCSSLHEGQVALLLDSGVASDTGLGSGCRWSSLGLERTGAEEN